jgi:OOP family OmpA-OmpF porin
VKKRIVLALATCLAYGCAATATAAIVVPYGWYLEANVGASNASDKTYPGNVDNTGLGESLNLGYKFTPFVAGEVGYANYANSRIKTASAGTHVAKDRHYSYEIAGKLMLPIGTTGAEVFGKLGVGRINSNVTVMDANAAAAAGYSFNAGTHSANGLYLGAGADYAITPNLLVNGQWARQKGSNNTGDLDLYSLGLAYIL